jgi:hypothetical protein
LNVVLVFDLQWAKVEDLDARKSKGKRLVIEKRMLKRTPIYNGTFTVSVAKQCSWNEAAHLHPEGSVVECT